MSEYSLYACLSPLNTNGLPDSLRSMIDAFHASPGFTVILKEARRVNKVRCHFAQ
ncbi:hypothetical protein [Vreelandella zhanjiangensis]|uniref:hypothetical protein n=1 Tax=Vreelandella zhanjiangensis TaxID=1121960 RepID=UPI000373EDA0|nr:hypothetical protein [Halomonas zhanjiangensis]